MKTSKEIVELCVKQQGLSNLTRNQVEFLDILLSKEVFSKLKNLGDMESVFKHARKFAKNNQSIYENI